MKSSKYTTLSEINVTPLVDVMLVLLIVFMVTAPLLKSGMKVNLPQSVAKEIDPSQAELITITQEGSLFWGNEPISIEILRDRLEKRKAAGRLKPILVQGDKAVQYGRVIEVMDVIKELQIEKLALVLKPRQL
ncbi:MAG TPA: biopolymer transporter ExbD [bacterium]